MTTKKKNKSKFPHLTLHRLIGAISFWGSATRLGLIGFIAFAVFIVQVLDSQAAPQNMTVLSAVLTQGQIFVYTIVSFLLLDVGYVTIARKYSFTALQDKIALIGSEIVLSIGYFLPYFVIVSDKFTTATRFVFVAVLLVLSARIVAGMLYGKVVQK